ncbi:hypothetical protein [Streptacidiphilus sp. PAMC 29251]
MSTPTPPQPAIVKVLWIAVAALSSLVAALTTALALLALHATGVTVAVFGGGVFPAALTLWFGGFASYRLL